MKENYKLSLYIPNGICLSTKSMQKIITGIATKVTHLLISAHTKEQHNKYNAQSSYTDLVTCAEGTRTAFMDLAKVTENTVKHQYSNDAGLVDEVETALQNMQITADNLLLCCQIVASTEGRNCEEEVLYRPSDIASCTSKAFQCVVILLLCVDNAEVRKIVCLANEAKQALTNLTAATSLKSLVGLYASLAEAVRKFFKSANERRSELLSAKSQEKLHRALSALKHSMPMLATACNMAIKYPRNEEATSSKLFALQQVDKTISEIVHIIKAQPESAGGDASGGQLGDFVLYARRIDEMLSLSSRYQMNKLELETAVQSLVHRVMTFVTFVNEHSPSTSRRADALIKQCRKLIELACVVSRLSGAARQSPLVDELASSAEDSSEFGSICRVARGKVRSLAKAITSAVTTLLADMFTITTEPAESLVKVYEQCRRSPRDAAASFKRDACRVTFAAHCRAAIAAARFAAMCGDDAEALAQMTLCSGQFENLTRGLRDFAFPDEDGAGDEGDLGQLRRDWEASLRDLIKFCAESVGLDQIAGHIEAEISRDFERCHEDIVNLDDSQLAKHLIAATGRAKLLAVIGNQSVACHTDPLFRNGVLAHIRKLQDVTAHVVASGNQLIEDAARLSAQESFLSAASLLKSNVSNVRLALQSRVNHPELASDERKGLRDFSDQDVICGMIREMHVLNQKLASLGFEPEVSPLSFNNDSISPEHSRELPCDETKVIDDLLATSGADITILTPRDQSSSTVSFGTDLHSVAADFLRAIDRNADPGAVSATFAEVKRANDIANAVVVDAEHLLSSSPVRVENCMKAPRFVEGESAAAGSVTIAEATAVWLKTLNESFRILEGCVSPAKDENDNRLVATPVCQSWSTSLHVLTALSLRALRPHTLCLRKFLEVPENGRNNEQLREKPEVDPSAGLKPDPANLLSRSQNALGVVGRSSETFAVLMRDVINLSRRDYSRRKRGTPQQSDSPGHSPHSSLLDAMSRILSESESIARSISECRQTLADLSKKIASERNAATNVSWLHLHALSCSAKIGALWNNVEKVTHMVLGVRKLSLPLDWLFQTYGKSDEPIIEYKRRVRTLALSTVEKAGKALLESTLNVLELTKLNKVNHRIEVTCASMEKITEFLLSKKDAGSLVHRHGHVIDHLMFLHQRFMLELSRMSLVVKELTVCNRMVNAHQSSGGGLHGPLSMPNHAGQVQSPNEVAGTGGAQGKSFEERLFELSKERKQREIELMELLSDVGDPETQMKQ